jgi:hypothetical protein
MHTIIGQWGAPEGKAVQARFNQCAPEIVILPTQAHSRIPSHGTPGAFGDKGHRVHVVAADEAAGIIRRVADQATASAEFLNDRIDERGAGFLDRREQPFAALRPQQVIGIKR